jgi:uncharacterized tellurite resistance protein B-like protein
MENTLSKEEFMLLAMLYVANADGKVSSDEVREMVDHFDTKTVADVRRLFNTMNDAAVLRCLSENKHHIADNEADRSKLLADLRGIVEADGRRSPMEEYVLHAVEQLLQ